MENISGWSTLTSSENVSASISNDSNGFRRNCLLLDYNFSASSEYIVIGKDYNIDLTSNYTLSFQLKVDNLSNQNLEIKIIDSTGATYLETLNDMVANSDWAKIEISSNNIEYGWGGINNGIPDKICRFEFAVTSNDGSIGKVYFDDLNIIFD